MTQEATQKTQKLSARDIVLCGLFTALIAVGAFIKIPIPYISFSLQTMFVALAGMLLGRRLGLASVAIYIVIGLAGLPIFTVGGGIGYVMQPSFGFLIGFLFYAYLTGYFTDKVKKADFKSLFLAQLPGLLLMYAIALPYFFWITNYYTSNPMSVGALFTYCFAALMPGEAAKCLLSAWLGRRLVPVLRRR